MIEIDEGILDAVGRAAHDEGRPEAEVMEDALRRYFGLRGIAVLSEIAEDQAAAGVELSDDEAMAIAVDELRAARAERDRRASA